MHVAPDTKTVAVQPAVSLPRMGQISFINCLPVVLPIERGLVDLPALVSYANPAALNEAYGKGSLDLGAMSSFYFLASGGLTLLPDISISCDGEVGSVLFFTRREVGRLGGARVAVPSSSATSVNLLRLMLMEVGGVNPDFIVTDEPDVRNDDVEAALVIGDRALAVDDEWSQHYRRIDLGRWWKDTTGLPMVFGVWAARRQWAEQPGNHERMTDIGRSLSEARALGLGELLPAVLAAAQARSGLTVERLRRYFEADLDFKLEDSHRQGLEKFAALCRKHRLLAP